jgi:hypothetical protein
MAGALDSMRDGFPVAFHFNLANPGAAATTAAILNGTGCAGHKVPVGYVFKPMAIFIASNADLTAGSIIAKVTDDGTVVVNGPQATLSDLVQQAAAVARNTQGPGIAAGHVIGVSLVADAGYLPVTADHDITVSGLLQPV